MQARRARQGERLRRQGKPDISRNPQRQGGDAGFDEGDGAHRTAAGPAQGAFALSVIRLGPGVLPRGSADPARLDRGRIDRNPLQVLRGSGNVNDGLRRRAVPGMRSGGRGPGKRQQDNQGGRLQSLCQCVEQSHAIQSIR